MNIHVGLCWSIEVGRALARFWHAFGTLWHAFSTLCSLHCSAPPRASFRTPFCAQCAHAAGPSPDLTTRSLPNPPKTNGEHPPPQKTKVAGEPLPLPDAAVVAVEFSIATHDFVSGEDDPTHSDAPVLIRAGTCWGWDDFFGREAYGDLVGEFAKWQNARGQMPLTCHIYGCG